MKILVYCQHVLGMGHFFRTLEILKALKGHDIILVTGGKALPAVIPAYIRKVSLPGLMMDKAFSGLYSPVPGKNVNQIKGLRKKALMELVQAEQPDVFVVELYPFGRKAFSFELEPVLERLAKRSGCRVVCSVRDLLVEKKDTAAYEARVVDRLNRYFNLVLIHSDPNLICLDQTFSRLDAIRIPIAYTGFVTPFPDRVRAHAIRKKLLKGDADTLIVAGAGSGSVGQRLLRAAAAASPRLDSGSKTILVTGPYMEKEIRKELANQSSTALRVFRFFQHFVDLLAAADLVLSMGGYNTLMNCLAAQTPCLALPFDQNREQGLRIRSLGTSLGIQRLGPRDLSPDRLARRIKKMLAHPHTQGNRPDLDGAARAARMILGDLS
ncbi:glycosyltransferase family protein [Desulfobacter vibrioformis]|uniref:glycosyltransferase family protein n=1 Tax=Desulfobacter vibrioformis TaxID=34031 RepID=UPI00055205CD|nr:glycosyltransferase [Desulfobacter vibrioformis]